MQVEKRLAELGIDLPAATSPAANYVNAVLTGNLLFLSGKGPYRPDGSLHTGIVGQDVSVEDAYQHARLTGLHLISTMKAELGDLDRVARIVGRGRGRAGACCAARRIRVTLGCPVTTNCSP